MAAKKKNAPPPPPPAAAHSTSSDEGSSSDEEEQFIAKPNPTKSKNSNSDSDVDKMNSDSGSGSESESESKSNKSTPTNPVAVLQKPSESEDPQSEEMTQKPSEADRIPSKKNPVIQRIWSPEDEMTLLKALLDYKVKNGKLPSKQEYSTFLSTISASIRFPVTEKQLYNKIRTSKFNYNQKKKKGDGATFQQPHDVMVFKICKELFVDVGKSSKRGAAKEPGTDVGKKNHKKRKVEVSGSGLEEANGGTASVGADVANDGVGSSGDGVRCHVYLAELIRDILHTEQNLGWLSTDYVMARIEESRLQDLEAKAKMLKIKEIKLHARKAQLVAEMLDLVANAVEHD